MAVPFTDIASNKEQLAAFLKDKSGQEVSTLTCETTGYTLLSAAVQEMFNADCINMILAVEGLDVNARDKSVKDSPLGGHTALTKLSENTMNFERYAQLLIDKGADVSAELPMKSEDERPRYMASVFANNDTKDKDSIEIIFASPTVKKSVVEGTLKGRFEDDKSVLDDLAYYGQNELVKKALALGADPNRRNKEGKNAVFYAIWNSRKEMLKDLVAAGGKLDFEPDTTVWGYTALHICVETGSRAMIEFIMGDLKGPKELLQKKGGGSRELKDKTAAEWAAMKNREDLVEEMKKYE